MTFASKEEAMDALEATRAEWLDAARAIARQLADDQGTVTVNDVRKLAPKLPDEVDPRVYGAIFSGPEWRCIGYVQSNRRTSHKRPIAKFERVQ